MIPYKSSDNPRYDRIFEDGASRRDARSDFQLLTLRSIFIAFSLGIGLLIRMRKRKAMTFGEKQAAATLLSMLGAFALAAGPVVGAIVGLVTGAARAIFSENHDLVPIIATPLWYAGYGLGCGGIVCALAFVIFMTCLSNNEQATETPVVEPIEHFDSIDPNRLAASFAARAASCAEYDNIAKAIAWQQKAIDLTTDAESKRNGEKLLAIYKEKALRREPTPRGER